MLNKLFPKITTIEEAKQLGKRVALTLVIFQLLSVISFVLWRNMADKITSISYDLIIITLSYFIYKYRSRLVAMLILIPGIISVVMAIFNTMGLGLLVIGLYRVTMNGCYIYSDAVGFRSTPDPGACFEIFGGLLFWIPAAIYLWAAIQILRIPKPLR